MFEEIGIFTRGIVLGLMIAAPVGPVGLMCIRRTLQKGLANGLATGFGAALADMIFGAVAALGVSVVLEFMRRYGVVIRVAGGGLLLFGAWHTWHDAPKEPKEKATPHSPMALVDKIVHENGHNNGNGHGHGYGKALLRRWRSLLRGVVTGFVFTLTNPLTLFAILAMVATFGNLETRLDASTLVAGIFTGSALWWGVLSGGVTLVRGHFTDSRVRIINRWTAVALAGLAVWAMASGVAGWIRHGPF